MSDWMLKRIDNLEKTLTELRARWERPARVLPFVNRIAMPANSTASILYSSPPHHSIIIHEIHISTMVSTTNNASNYWTLDLQTIDGAGALTPLAGTSISTSADSANTWTHHDLTGLSVTIADGVDLIVVYATKTLGAGALYWGAPIVEYARV